MCEKKRRHLQKDEKRVRFGHYAFQRFYKLSAGAKKEKTYEDFRTQYYNASSKFGSVYPIMCVHISERYIDYVLTSGVKLDSIGVKMNCMKSTYLTLYLKKMLLLHLNVVYKQ